MPIPSLSISCALPFGAAVAGATGADLTAAGPFAAFAAAVAFSAAARVRASSSAFSRSRS